MKKEFTLGYWMDDGWYVGRLREAPDVFSQGKTFEELQLNIKDAFDLMRSACAGTFGNQGKPVQTD